MTAKLFEAALGIASPWYVNGVEFDTEKKMLSIAIDFVAGSRFAVPGIEGVHPAHDTVTKRYRHLNFFQHECHLEVRVPRVRLPDGGIRQVEPDWAGRLAGFTLLFEALIMTMCREMTFSAVSRLVGLSWHQVVAICKRYVALGLAQADFSEVTRLAADEASKSKGHDYITLVADADQRRVLLSPKARMPTRSGHSPPTSPPTAAIRQRSSLSRSTCRKPSSRELPSTCPMPGLPSTSSMSSPMPIPPWR